MWTKAFIELSAPVLVWKLALTDCESVLSAKLGFLLALPKCIGKKKEDKKLLSMRTGCFGQFSLFTNHVLQGFNMSSL